MERPPRNRAIDFMKVWATFSIVILHTSALYVNSSLKGPVILITLFRFGVPAFVMITGYLYLGLNIDFHFKSKIWAAIKVLIFSTILFSIPPILVMILRHQPFDWYAITTFGYHLWYLNLLVMLFIALPVLKQLNKNPQIMLYTTIVTVLLGLVLPEIVYLLHDPNLEMYLKKFHFEFVRNYLILLLLGKYLFELLKRRWIIFGGALATLFLLVYTLNLNPATTDYARIHYFGNTNIVLILASLLALRLILGLYQWVKDSAVLNKIMTFLAPHFLRIYIFHVIPMFILFTLLKKMYGLPHSEWAALIQISGIAIISMMVATLVSYLLDQTNVTKKWFSLKRFE